MRSTPCLVVECDSQSQGKVLGRPGHSGNRILFVFFGLRRSTKDGDRQRGRQRWSTRSPTFRSQTSVSAVWTWVSGGLRSSRFGFELPDVPRGGGSGGLELQKAGNTFGEVGAGG